MKLTFELEWNDDDELWDEAREEAPACMCPVFPTLFDDELEDNVNDDDEIITALLLPFNPFSLDEFEWVVAKVEQCVK